MPATIPDTSSWETIKEYLEFHRDAIEDTNNEEVIPYVLPIFISETTNDPTVMMQFHRWLHQHVSVELRYIVTENLELLRDANLNLYKFKILLGMRGTMDNKHIIDFVKANSNSENVMEVTKHKDFPQEGKDYMYEIYPEVEYLSKEAQDIFVF